MKNIIALALIVLVSNSFAGDVTYLKCDGKIVGFDETSFDFVSSPKLNTMILKKLKAGGMSNSVLSKITDTMVWGVNNKTLAYLITEDYLSFTDETYGSTAFYRVAGATDVKYNDMMFWFTRSEDAEYPFSNMVFSKQRNGKMGLGEILHCSLQTN
jgi:hypothetical protein